MKRLLNNYKACFFTLNIDYLSLKYSFGDIDQVIDWSTKEQLKGIVCKVTFRTCSFTYNRESKRNWKSRGTEHNLGTNGNVNSAIKQHAETSHDVHPIYANMLETGVCAKKKRLFLESLHSS